MSFTFNNDLGGTTTSVQENGDAASTVTSSGITAPDFERGGCPMKEFLSAIEAKGIKSCGDIQIVEGDLYFAGGTSDKSIIKEIGLVFGVLSGGVFSPQDPDLKGISRLGDGADAGEPPESDLRTDTGDAAIEGDADQSGALPQTIEDSTVEEIEPTDDDGNVLNARWYLRLVRPNGDIQYSDFEPLNDLMDAAAGSGNVRSMLDAMNELDELATLAGDILDKNALASQTDVDKLELKVDKDLVTMSDALDAFEYRLLQHIKSGDARLLSNLQTELNASGLRYQAYYDGSKMTAEAALVSPTSCVAVSSQTVAGAMKIDISGASDITNMLIDVRICDRSNGEVLRNDIDIAWTAAYGSTDDGDPTIDLSYIAVGCEDFSDLHVQFVAVDCSAQSIPTPSLPDHSDESYSPVFGADLTLNTPDAAADSDSDLQKLSFNAANSETVEPSSGPLAGPLSWSSSGIDSGMETIAVTGFTDVDAFIATSWQQGGPIFTMDNVNTPSGFSMGEVFVNGMDLVKVDESTISFGYFPSPGSSFGDAVNGTPSDQIYAWNPEPQNVNSMS